MHARLARRQLLTAWGCTFVLTGRAGSRLGHGRLRSSGRAAAVTAHASAATTAIPAPAPAFLIAGPLYPVSALNDFFISARTLVLVNVLVVDDERAVRSALRRALALEGYAVEEAGDGHAALDFLRVRTADAVVLDVLMPGVDGLEVCRRLRAAGDRTPVLMLTARESVEDRVSGLDAGADDYLVKPFALEELLARLRALLRRASANGDGPDGNLRFDGLVLAFNLYEARV